VTGGAGSNPRIGITSCRVKLCTFTSPIPRAGVYQVSVQSMMMEC